MGCSIKKDFEDAFAYNLAVEYAFNDRINFVAEVFGDTILIGKFNDNAASGQIGLNYGINDSLSYDVGCTLGISDADPDFKVTTGLTFFLTLPPF